MLRKAGAAAGLIWVAPAVMSSPAFALGTPVGEPPVSYGYGSGGITALGTVTIARPSGAADGDLMIAVGITYGSANFLQGTISGAGWTLLSGPNQGAARCGRAFLFSKQVQASDPTNQVFTLTGSAHQAMMAVSLVAYHPDGGTTVAVGGHSVDATGNSFSDGSLVPWPSVSAPSSGVRFVALGTKLSGLAASWDTVTEPEANEIIANYQFNSGDNHTATQVTDGTVQPSNGKIAQSGACHSAIRYTVALVTTN